ncbi:hypothetical protein, partial [Bacillus thuringiensis]
MRDTSKWIAGVTTFGVLVSWMIAPDAISADSQSNLAINQMQKVASTEQTVITHDFNSITRQIISSWIEKHHHLEKQNSPNQPVGNKYRIERVNNSQVKELRVNVGLPKRISTGDKELVRTLSHTAENASKGKLEVGYIFKGSVKQESSFTNLKQITHIAGVSQEIEIRLGSDTKGFSSSTGIKYEYQ